MGQGGAGNNGAENTDATKTNDNEVFARSIVKLVKDNEGLRQAAKEFLENKKIENIDLNDPEKVMNLLRSKEGQEFLNTMKGHLENESFKNFLKQVDQNPPMRETADRFGRSLIKLLGAGALLAVIGTTLVGGIAGLSAAIPFIGLGVMAFAAIAVLGFGLFSLFKNRGEIGKKVEDMAKEVTHSLKNLMDKVSIGKSNAERHLKKFESKQFQEEYSKATGKSLPDDAALIKQYFNEDGLAALKECIIGEPDAGKIKLADGTELKLEDLERLEEKGKSTFNGDKDKFIKELNKFAPIMSQGNKTVRAQVEAEQDKIHERKNLQTFIPSSAGYHGSRASTELLSKIDPGKKRTGMEDFLKKASELKKPFREQNGGLYEVLQGNPYNLNRDTLDNLEKKGSELSNEGLDSLASSLNNLTPDQIKDLNAKINDLKKEQSKGPQSQTSQIEETPAQHAPERTAGIPTP